MSDRRPYAVLQIRELGHGIQDLPAFDTSTFRSFAVRLDPYEDRPPVDRRAETLVIIVAGSLTVAWCDATRVSTELGAGDTAWTTPPAAEALLAGSEGANLPRDGKAELGHGGAGAASCQALAKQDLRPGAYWVRELP
jgi:hypothetical protein